MIDTIELLEAIGSDASLRYAPTSELVGLLEQANSEFAVAVASGNGAVLRQMTGCNEVAQQIPQSPQTHAIAFLDLDWNTPAAN